MSGERLSGEERWKEFSNSFKARSAAESSSEQSRSLSVRISTARRSVADDVTKSARNLSFAVRRSSRWSTVRRETPDSRRSGTLPGRRERRMSQPVIQALERTATLSAPALDYAKAAAAEAEVKKEVEAMVARAMRAVEARYDRKPSIFDPRKI